MFIFPKKKPLNMPSTEILIREAEINDSENLLIMIKELAEYEKLSHEVTATPEDIRKTMFQQKDCAKSLFIYHDNNLAGFILYFFTYSTFTGKYDIYIEDVYVREEYRGHGLGKMLFKKVCEIADQNNCNRVEWSCLDWNTPSVDFYLKLGAEPMSDWTKYKLTEDQIRYLSKNL